MTVSTPPPDLLRTLEPLSSLSRARREELAALCRHETVPAGTLLFGEGERDRDVIYLLRGALHISTARTGQLHTLRTGDTRHPVADRQPRPVTAVTGCESELLRIDSDVFETALTWNALAEDAAPGPDSAWMGLLKQALVFRQLPPAHLTKLAARMQPLPVKAGQVILHEGEAGDSYYIIESGSARVERRDRDGNRQSLAELGPGSAFGEEALVSGAPRNATVAMTSHGILRRLAKKDFNELLGTPLLHWIDYADAARRVAAGRAQWLDVRHELEYRHVHVPGARSCPLHQLRSECIRLDLKVEYVCYCRSGRRSAAAAFLLAERGFRALVLRGGFEALPAFEVY